MFNNSTQRLAALTTSIYPLVKQAINSPAYTCVYLALFLGSPSFLNLGQKTGRVGASARVSLLNVDIPRLKYAWRCTPASWDIVHTGGYTHFQFHGRVQQIIAIVLW